MLVDSPQPAVAEKFARRIAELQRELAAEGIGPPPNARYNVETFKPVVARWIRFTIAATNASQPCIDELEIYEASAAGRAARNVALASRGAKATASSTLPNYAIHKLEHVNDGRPGNARSWISNESNSGWVQIELPRATRIDRIAWGRDRTGRFKDRVATRYVIEAASQPGNWEVVASSAGRVPLADWMNMDDVPLPGKSEAEARHLRAKFAELKQLREKFLTASTPPKPQMVYGGSFSQPQKTHRLYRGDPMAPREVVAPAPPAFSGAPELAVDTPEQQRRLKLAEWIVDEKNPLAARVIVNRLWQHHFGAGIVTTPGDFGAGGTKPSHPELLDFLADELMRSGWSLKHIHRLILLSSTYRQSSRPDTQGISADAACRLLWRYPPRRLSAEPIRDSILHVTGSLDLQMGGHGFSVFDIVRETVRHYHPLQQFGPPQWRRMIYMNKVRQEQDAVFGILDCPDGGQTIDKRSRSTTPLQALNLLNSNFMLQQSDLLAARLRREAGASTDDQVQRAFWLCFGRAPGQEELAGSRELAQQHGLPALCRALLNSNEFLFVP